jgi:protein TonB
MAIALAPIRHLPKLNVSPARVRVLAFTASILLHLVLLLRYGGNIGVSTPETQTTGTTRVTMVASVAQSRPRAEARQEKKPAESGEQPTPPQEEQVEALEESLDDHQQENSSEQVASEARQSQARSAVDEGIAADAKQRYLATLLGHIEAHKHYPRAARRRGQEGVIRVSFTLLSPTELGAIHVAGGSTLLQSAAREAVTRSIPFPAAPEGVRFPLQLEFKIRFSLKD